MKQVFFSLLLVFLFACTESKLLSKETKVFSYFLQETFNWKIAQEPHAYILVNGVMCKGCVSKVMLELPDLLPEKSSQHTIITNNPQVFSEEIKKRAYFYEDTTNLISSINLAIENITIVHTNEHKVVRIDKINLENMNDDLSVFFDVESK